MSENTFNSHSVTQLREVVYFWYYMRGLRGFG